MYEKNCIGKDMMKTGMRHSSHQLIRQNGLPILSTVYIPCEGKKVIIGRLDVAN